MSEIAKCPLCGKIPIKMVFGAGYAQDGYRCCGCTFDNTKLWNQYAASMELAKAETKTTKAIEDGAAFDCARIDLSAAKMRVLEVFK